MNQNERDNFLLKDKIRLVHSSFIKDGWVTIYKSEASNAEKDLIFCCIVDSTRIKTYSQDSSWGVEPSREGKPTVMSRYSKGRSFDTYRTYADKGLEPFLYSRWFFHNGERYIDVSEEFVLYFKLYENGESKQNRKYYYIDDLGELDEVIVIEPKKVIIKLRYLMEYISVRKVHFAITFDLERFESGKLEDLGITAKSEDYENEKFYFHHIVRDMQVTIEGRSLQSAIHGKAFIHYDKKKTNTYHFDLDNCYEKFITGYDSQGCDLLEECSRENNRMFTMTFFKKEVLNKYYNEPTKYSVDGWHVSAPFFTLKIDNQHETYVAVFLTELGMLPHKEQLHWKQYNVAPQIGMGMSQAYYNTMIEGNWAEHSETADLFFKEKYNSFNTSWKEQFGWDFYKPLSENDKHNFTALHIPTTNNIKAFCEQMLAIVKLTIDSLNEAELAKGISLEQNAKGITKLEKFLESKGRRLPDMITFLRHLQDLRSGLMAHRFSQSNKNAKKAMEYFKLKDDNLVEVATDIFQKSIYTLNTLEKLFLSETQGK